MPSKFDELRSGNAVEIEPGLSGRLNKKNKTLELSSGEILNVANDSDFFPSSEKSLNLSRQKESIERGIKGTPGEFLHQFGTQGLAGGVSDWVSYLTQTGDEYATRKQAENEVSARISKESPWTSGAATSASMAADIAATRGMSALKAAPALTLGSAGSRIVTEPEEVATETLTSAGLGYGLDKAGNYLNRVAQRRGQARALPARQEAVRAQNALEQQAVNEANLAQTQEFNNLKQNVKTRNELALKSHEDELLARKNRMIQDANDFQAKKAARDTEVLRLENEARIAKAERSANKERLESEYKIAKENAKREDKFANDKFKLDQQEYQEALARMPELEKRAQQEYSQGVVANAEKIARAFPKNSKIYSSQISPQQFIDDVIAKGELVGTREGNQTAKILKSLFPEGEILTSQELAARYKALEGAIQKATPEVKNVLDQFKTHLGEKLTPIMADNIAYNRIFPTLQNQVRREVESALNAMPLQETGILSRPFLKKRAEKNLNAIFREISPQDFVNKFQSGEIREKILSQTFSPNDFSANLKNLVNPKRVGKANLEEFEKHGIKISDPAKQKLDEFNNIFSAKLDKALAKAELKMMAVQEDAAIKLGGKVKKTYGTAAPLEAPQAPISPKPVPQPEMPEKLPSLPAIEYPENVTAPPAPPLPPNPNLIEAPIAPTTQPFIPNPEPTLAPAQGMTERAADFLERDLMGGKGLVNNPLTKLAGLKYLFGKAAIPAEAAYLGMKGLTSPTAGGEIARLSFKQAGIQAIISMAEKYPSYHDGILENPMERRSLTKEIENDPEIPIEQKAILQSKVNRGKNLQERL